MGGITIFNNNLGGGGGVGGLTGITASDGLTADAIVAGVQNVRLGGTLTQGVEINAESHNLNISGDDGLGNSVFTDFGNPTDGGGLPGYEAKVTAADTNDLITLLLLPEIASLSYVSGDGNAFSQMAIGLEGGTNTALLSLFDDTAGTGAGASSVFQALSGSVIMGMYDGSIGDSFKGITVAHVGNMIVADDIAEEGLQYKNDYSAYFATNDLSIPSVGYVKSLVGKAITESGRATLAAGVATIVAPTVLSTSQIILSMNSISCVEVNVKTGGVGFTVKCVDYGGAPNVTTTFGFDWIVVN